MSVVSLPSSRAASGSAACPLCDGHGTRVDGTACDRRRADLLPWVIVLTAASVVAVVGVGPDRWFGIGASAGVLSGAICAWVSIRQLKRGRGTAHAAELRALREDADARVAMVIKQFEWAVNDVAKLKRDVERAEASADALVERARERERYLRRLERQLFETRERLVDLAGPTIPLRATDESTSNEVPIRWGLHLHEDRPILELQVGVTAHRPTRIRILDRDGQVIAVSPPANIGEHGITEFTIDMPPADLIADLDAAREINYAIEALSQYEWRPVRLEDSGSRTRAVSDKQGRWYRVADAADAAQVLSSSTLN